MKKIAQWIVVSIVVLLLTAIGVYLFAGNSIVFYIQTNWQQQKAAARDDSEILKIAYAFSPLSLNPTRFNYNDRSFLVDVYEGLVKTDQNLRIQSGIAVSWGLVKDDLWEFRLRPDVKFHNGKLLTAEDVVYSINLAKTDNDSELGNLLSTITSVESKNDEIYIQTNGADPLLLQKLAVTYIVPAEFLDFDNPVGTGPYKFISRADSSILLQRNDFYWGNSPAFKNVELLSIPDRRERIESLEKGEIDVLANVPPNVACSMVTEYTDTEGCSGFENENFELKTMPSLEVSFLMFNFNNEFFKDVQHRKAVMKMFDYNVFKNLAFGFALPATQFVGNGVFGFDPKIVKSVFDINDAEKAFSDISTGFERTEIEFDYPESLAPIGGYIRDQFQSVGVDVELNPLSPEELDKKILSGKSQFYYFGWKSELGDSSDILKEVFHSKNTEYGAYNGMNYHNEKLDGLIEKSTQTLDLSRRLKLLQEAMNIVVTEDAAGVPLFESEAIFAVKKGINFVPRIDGYINAYEIK